MIDHEDIADAAKAKKAKDRVTYWLGEVDLSRKREKDFRKRGKAVNELYEAEKTTQYQFNILYSNTETLSPALFNNLPRPQVDRRFKDEDPLGKISSKVTQRTLEYLLDSNDASYTSFPDMMEQAVLEALLPGRGITRFKYEATFQEMPAGEVGEIPAETEPQERVEHETVCGEDVSWDSFLHGYAKRWSKVPWVSFEHFMDKDEVKATFQTVPKELKATAKGAKGEDEDSSGGYGDDELEPTLYHVYEIWDKKNKKVVFVSPGYPDDVLKEVDDPLKLSGFYPCPKPLSFLRKVTNMVPVPLYTMYEEQANELNQITLRINRIIKAMKVRGFYNGNLGDGLEKLFESDDNAMLPTSNLGLAGQDTNSLDKDIWFMPLEKLASVLQQLYLQRTQIKQVIYEVTGISDILRGSSVASETATAQDIKNQWGTLRLKRMQKEVSRYVRDCLRIMAEIAVTKLSPESLAAMTGLNFPSAEEKQQAQMAMQMMQQQQMMQGQGQGMPGQPPAAPPPPPDKRLMQVLTLPTWADILGVLQDNLQRNYKIDIETNSTVDAEATEDKKDIGEFLNAVAQFMNGVAPMVQEGILPFDAAKAFLLAVVRKFRFGVEVEDQIAEMKEPPKQKPGEDPAAQALKAKTDMEMKSMQAEAEVKKASNAMGMQAAQQDMELKRLEAEFKKAEIMEKMKALQMTGQLAMEQHNVAMLKLSQQAKQAMQPKKGV